DINTTPEDSATVRSNNCKAGTARVATGLCPVQAGQSPAFTLPPSALPNYLTSTVAPASVNFFLMVSASSFETPSLIALGAPSTRSLASFSPRLVTSRTALITLILLAPIAVRTTANSVCSSTGAAAAAPAPAPATTTGAAAA